MSYYSQFGQDKFIYEEVLNKQEKGFFVDIGASEPVRQNNTIFFERLGWKGIVIEPVKEVYDNLVKERNCICENTAISDKNEIRKFLQILGPAQGLSGLLEGYHIRHLFRIVDELRQQGGDVNIVDMNCVTLKFLMEKHNVESIDYMSLDVEGKELDILKTIDFDAVDIRSISVENNYRDPGINEFLTSKNYVKLTELDVDEIYHKV
jgi:FkbM family methyltransferase